MFQGSFTRLGAGSLGAKAGGLARITSVIEAKIAPTFRADIAVEVPRLAAVATDVFDRFMDQNRLDGFRSMALPDPETASAFANAGLSVSWLAGLDAWLAQAQGPLTVRSSSLLEDGATRPFAGVYATRMLANSHPDLDVRREQVIAAIKYVYASTFFRRARDYFAVDGRATAGDRMGVVIQDVIGTASHGRFYPHVSGVARSLNFYPFGLAKASDGVVDLALGLGKAIVHDGVAWSYSPACPQANPPYNRPRDLVKQSQKEFWAIDLARSLHRPTEGGDAATKYALIDAEKDGVLEYVASTYLADDDRIVAGVGRQGPRIVDFAPILKANLVPLTPLIAELLDRGQTMLRAPVEIEFAMTFQDPPRPARFGFLQIRPMADAYAPVQVEVDDLRSAAAVVSSESALGNGDLNHVRDVVYVRPQHYDPGQARAVASELQALNRILTVAGRSYLLVGPGRWGSSDPTAGIPVDFAQISAARVIVESALPDTDLMLSQGSHFFHNITSFRVLYLAVSDRRAGRVDWDWLEAQPAAAQTDRIRHLWLKSPLQVKVDGRTGRGVILR
jgi:hypothetical protein